MFSIFNRPAELGIGGVSFASRGWRPERCYDAPRSITFSLNNSEEDARQIIRHLARFARDYGKSECVVKFARCLVRSITENNGVEAQFSMVTGFMLDHFVYQADPRGAEYVRSPVRMIAEYCQHGYTRGDCDDGTLLACSLFSALGIRTRVVAVRLQPEGPRNHVLLQAEIRGEWKWFDPCNKDVPDKAWTDIIHEVVQ
jgi:hypothetical protein